MARSEYNTYVWNHKQTRTGDDVSFEWDSYESYKSDFDNIRKMDPALYNRARECGASDSVRWYGTEGGFNGMLDRIEKGWPELREQLAKMLSDCELEVPRFPSMSRVRRRKIRRGDDGDDLHQERVWEGNLETAWDKPTRIEKVTPNNKRITICFDVTANGWVTNEQAMWRAALCMLLVQSLTKAGRTFEIWVTDSTSHPFISSNAPRRLWTAWCVKRTADPVVMDRLCSMVSVGFMRTVGFMAEGAGQWEVSSSFGGALNSGLPHTLRDRAKAGEVVIRIGECYSKPQALEHYKQVWNEIESRNSEAA